MSQEKPLIWIMAGESSGDLYGARIAQEVKKQCPGATIRGMGGHRMRDAGVVLTATNTLMAELAQDWSTPHGQQLIGLLFSDVFPALGASIA